MKKLQQAKEQLEKAKKLNKEGKYQASIDICEEIAPIFEEAEDWEGYVKCLNEWGKCLGQKGRYDDGIERISMALKLMWERLASNIAYIATLYNNMGVLCSKKYDYGSAIECFQKALHFRRKCFGEIHLSTAYSFYSIGITSFKKGDFKRAIQYHHKALYIRLKGRGGIRIADSYNDLGACFSRKR